jgi:hypothetical protein
MCEKSLLENVVRNVKTSEVKWIKGANHALKVKGFKEEDIITDIGHFICDWCKTKLPGSFQVSLFVSNITLHFIQSNEYIHIF